VNTIINLQEEVIVHLVHSKCLPALLYGLEVCPLTTLCFKKTGTLFISFIIHSNDDQFTRNFYQM